MQTQFLQIQLKTNSSNNSLIYLHTKIGSHLIATTDFFEYTQRLNTLVRSNPIVRLLHFAVCSSLCCDSGEMLLTQQRDHSLCG